MAYRAGNLSHPHVDDIDDDDDEDKKVSPSAKSGHSTSLAAAMKAAKHSGRIGKSMFTPKYDVLFSRTTWSYYIRVFMPMCEPASLQSGIKLDLLRGQLSLKGRYQTTASLPPWCTQNESIADLEIVQSLPPSASGDFVIDIPLPFDVDRSARKEVHVTDIGVIVSLKRLKEEIPQMEFKIHSFTNPNSSGAGGMSGHTLPLPPAPSSTPRPSGSSQSGVSSSTPSLLIHTGVPLAYS